MRAAREDEPLGLSIELARDEGEGVEAQTVVRSGDGGSAHDADDDVGGDRGGYSVSRVTRAQPRKGCRSACSAVGRFMGSMSRIPCRKPHAVGS